MFIYQKPESYYLHTDRLGSGSAVTDGRGRAVHVLGYMPYGETLLDLSHTPYETPYQFTGYEKDQETGLHYAGARYYDSWLSIFNSTDPMWYKYPHLSPYAYCANNPLSYVDPSGKEFDPASNKIAQKTEKEVRAKLESLPAGNDDVRNELNKTLDDIQRMRADKSTIYSYKTTSSKDAQKLSINGPTTMNVGKNKKDKDLIHMYYDSEGTLIHESRHGGDMARGTLAKDKSNYGVSHEISAYRAQYAFEGYINLRNNFLEGSIPENPNTYYYKFQNGIENINSQFIQNIVWFYRNHTEKIMLYDEKTGRVPIQFYKR